MQIIPKINNNIEIAMFSNERNTYLVITENGEWIFWRKVYEIEKEFLGNIGIELIIDAGMSDPS